MAQKKAILAYEELVPLIIDCNVEGAQVFIDGSSIGLVRDGQITKALNRDAEIKIVIKKAGYWEFEEILLMNEEKRLEVTLEEKKLFRWGIEAVFGGGMMGSLNTTLFIIPQWWFVKLGVGFTLSSIDPLFLNVPVYLKTGLFMIWNDRSRFRPYLGGIIQLNLLQTISFEYITVSALNNFTHSFEAGNIVGIEFKVVERLRFFLEGSVFWTDLHLMVRPIFIGSGLQIALGIRWQF